MQTKKQLCYRENSVEYIIHVHRVKHDLTSKHVFGDPGITAAALVASCNFNLMILNLAGLLFYHVCIA